MDDRKKDGDVMKMTVRTCTFPIPKTCAVARIVLSQWHAQVFTFDDLRIRR